MINSKWLRWIARGATLILSLSQVPSVCGQGMMASLTGLVTDPTGAVVPEAQVIATETSTHVTRTTATNGSGYYALAALAVGTYTVTVEKPGFKKAVRNNLVLAVGEDVRLDVSLEVGSQTQSITVTATVASLNTQNASPGDVIAQRTVTNIPLVQRNWDDLLILAPGVQGDKFSELGASTSSSRTGGVNVHGVRSLQNNFVLDGVDNNSISENVQELSTQTIHESVEAIREFNIITNPYSAEYGRSPGAAIVVTTKSGTNQYRGSLWWFGRNDKFDANDFFANRSGSAKPEDRQNQFGGNIGMPIIKDRAFLFFNYEGTRIVRGTTRLANVPMPNERSGDFSPQAAARNRVKGATYATIFDGVGDCRAKAPSAFNPDGSFVNNQIPSICIDPVVQRIVNLIPPPNVVPATGPLNVVNFVSSLKQLDDNDSYTARGDVYLSAKDNVFLRWTFGDRSRFVPGVFGGLIDGTRTAQGTGQMAAKSYGVALGWTHLFSSSVLNEFRLGWGRDRTINVQDPFNLQSVADFGIKGVPFEPAIGGGLPAIVVNPGGGIQKIGGTEDAFAQLGSPRFLPKFQFTNAWQYADTLSVSHGPHQFKFGAELRLPMRNIFLDVPAVRGSLTFRGLFTGQVVGGSPIPGIPWADFLLGYPSQAELSNRDVVDQRFWMMSYFVQDDWKVTPKLTLNLGLRYDFATWPLEARDRMTNLDEKTGKTFGVKDSAVGRALVESDKTNLAPRLGLAYQLTSNTVLRTGYGRFYQLFERLGSEDMLALNLPFFVNNVVSTSSSTVPVNGIRVQNGFNLSLDPSRVNPVKVLLRAVGTNSKHASIDQWNLGIQRTFPGGIVLTIDYVGTKGTHLSVTKNLNEQFFTPGGFPFSPSIFPFPNLGAIEFRENQGNSTYNGLEISVDKRLSHGLTFGTAYTYSHSIDWARDNLSGSNLSSQIFPPNARDVRRTNRGSSDFDVRHRFVAHYVWDLPSPNFSGAGLLGSAGRNILRDWTVSGVATIHTGLPITIRASGNESVLGDRTDLVEARADCLGDPSLPSGQRTITRFFDTGAFRVPKPARLGTCGRSTVRGPRTVVFDFALARHFRYFGERRSLEFRWEMLNALNHALFGPPNRDASSKNDFGQIQQLAGDPRIMQFALKFVF